MSARSDHEDELRHALQQQATGVEVVTDFAPKAIARRRRDHRNRMALAATACVAGIAIAVPALWSANRPDLVPGPALPTVSTSSIPSSIPSSGPSSSPSSGPSSTPPQSTTPTPIRTDASDQSAPPTSATSTPTGFAYAVDNVLHLGRATITLPQGATVEKFARLQAGAVVVSWRVSGPTMTQVLDGGGRVLADLRDTRLWVVSRDRTRVATWDGRTVKVLDSAGRVLERRDTALRPIDIVDDDVYLAGDNDAQGWNVVTGRTKAMPPGLVAVSPSRSRAAIVYTKAPDSLDSCWAVVDLTSSRFTRLAEKCGNTYVPTAFSANGTYLVGENASSGGFFSRFMIVRADTGKAVFGGGPDAAGEGAGWGVRIGADERTVWLSANTSNLGLPAKTNTISECRIGAGCSEVTPSLKTPRGQPRYVVESPTSD